MMLCDLTDADCKILYEASDTDTRKGFNIIKANRYSNLMTHLFDHKIDPTKLFEHVEKKCADMLVNEMISQVANDG